VSQLLKQESEETVLKKKDNTATGQQCQVTTGLTGQCQCLQFRVVFAPLQNAVR
jgi:hypothetical protein